MNRTVLLGREVARTVPRACGDEPTIALNHLEGDSWDDFENKVISSLVPSSEQFMKALNSTNYRLSQWLKTRSIRAIAKKLDVPQKIIRRRIKNFRFSYDAEGSAKVWFGMNDIPFAELNPQNYSSGVKTGSGNYYVEGAFTTKSKRTGRVLVLKRRGKTWVGKGIRGPLDTVTLTISNIMSDWLEKELNKQEFEEEFFKIFERELKWRTEQ